MMLTGRGARQKKKLHQKRKQSSKLAIESKRMYAIFNWVLWAFWIKTIIKPIIVDTFNQIKQSWPTAKIIIWRENAMRASYN